MIIAEIRTKNCQTVLLYFGLTDKKSVIEKLRIFSYPSILTFVLGAEKNRLIETVLLSTHNICLVENAKAQFSLS